MENIAKIGAAQMPECCISGRPWNSDRVGYTSEQTKTPMARAKKPLSSHQDDADGTVLHLTVAPKENGMIMMDANSIIDVAFEEYDVPKNKPIDPTARNQMGEAVRFMLVGANAQAPMSPGATIVKAQRGVGGVSHFLFAADSRCKATIKIRQKATAVE